MARAAPANEYINASSFNVATRPSATRHSEANRPRASARGDLPARDGPAHRALHVGIEVAVRVIVDDASGRAHDEHAGHEDEHHGGVGSSRPRRSTTPTGSATTAAGSRSAGGCASAARTGSRVPSCPTPENPRWRGSASDRRGMRRAPGPAIARPATPGSRTGGPDARKPRRTPGSTMATTAPRGVSQRHFRPGA